MLLLDEPLSNLDARIRVELRGEIRAVQQRVGITAIHVTHDREEAMVLADRIVVMNQGRIEQQGTPEEVYHKPVSPFVASFMGADNIVRLKVQSNGAGNVAATFADDEEQTIARLPVGEGGVHLAAAPNSDAMDAYFRAEAVRLSALDEPPPPGSLGLAGAIEHASYPGGVWRYVVRAGAHRFVIDDPRKYQSGQHVRVMLPATALHLFPSAN